MQSLTDYVGICSSISSFFPLGERLDLHVAGCLASKLQKCASRHGTEVSAVLLGGELLHPALRLSTCAGGCWFSAAGKEKGAALLGDAVGPAQRGLLDTVVFFCCMATGEMPVWALVG